MNQVGCCLSSQKNHVLLFDLRQNICKITFITQTERWSRSCTDSCLITLGMDAIFDYLTGVRTSVPRGNIEVNEG